MTQSALSKKYSFSEEIRKYHKEIFEEKLIFFVVTRESLQVSKSESNLYLATKRQAPSVQNIRNQTWSFGQEGEFKYYNFSRQKIILYEKTLSIY